MQDVYLVQKYLCDHFLTFRVRFLQVVTQCIPLPQCSTFHSSHSPLFLFACRSACRCFCSRLSSCSIKRFRLTLTFVFAISVRAIHLFNCFRDIRHQKIGLLNAQNGIRIWLRIVLMSVKNRRRRIHQRVKPQFFADALICNFLRNTSQSTPPPVFGYLAGVPVPAFLLTTGISNGIIVPYFQEERKVENVPIMYTIDILAELKRQGWTTYRIQKEKVIGNSTLQRLKNDEPIGLDAVGKICEMLHCQPGDILEYIPEEK